MQTKSYYIIYGGRSSEEFNLNIEHRVTKPTPEMEYQEIRVPKGRTLYRENSYKDIEIIIPFVFVTEPNEWERYLRNVKSWLSKKENRILKFSDDLDVFYKVNKIRIDGISRSKKRIGKFNVTFTCNPYQYLVDGIEEIKLKKEGNKIENNYEIANPIYTIHANGSEGLTINLKINGISTKITVVDGLIIDTDKGLILTKYGELAYNKLEGEFKNLYLKEGENTISYSNGGNATITMIPNWRCI